MTTTIRVTRCDRPSAECHSPTSPTSWAVLTCRHEVMPDDSIRLFDPDYHDLQLSFLAAYRRAGLLGPIAADRAGRLALAAGTFGRCGHGGDDQVAYLFHAEFDPSSRRTTRVFRVYPRSRRRVLSPLIRSAVLA